MVIFIGKRKIRDLDPFIDLREGYDFKHHDSEELIKDIDKFSIQTNSKYKADPKRGRYIYNCIYYSMLRTKSSYNVMFILVII